MSDLGGDPTWNYHGDNPESNDAFRSIRPEDRRKQINRIIEYIRSCGPRGATCDQAEIALKLAHQTCSARFTDAKRAGLIVPAEQRRRTRSGRWARVYCVAAP